jgi:ribonuclease P protein component
MVASLLSYSRVGIIVPGYGHTAVERNKVKRRLRDIIRRTVLPMLHDLASVDLVARAGPRAYGTSFDGLQVELMQGIRSLLSRSGVVV